MMKKNFKFLMAAAALFVGFTNCSNDDEVRGLEQGEETTMMISIPVAKTYATDEGLATESGFTTADVFIFQGTTLEKHVPLQFADFTKDPSANKYTVNQPITVMTGTKNIYVGLNLPAGAAASISSGVESVLTYANVSSIVGDNAFSMFSVNSTANIGKVVQLDAAQNKFDIAVERWAAKVTSTVKDGVEGARVDAAAATFSDLFFCLGNINTKMYPLQKFDGNIIKDPNWTGFAQSGGAYDRSDFYSEYNETPAGYVKVDAAGTAANSRKAKYALENTSDAHYQGEVTFASIRAKFQPEKFAKYNATDGLQYDANNSAVTGSLFVVQTNAGVLYFKAKSEAEAYASSINLNPTEDVKEYKEGYCYYYIWLDANKPGQIHSTIRNHFFATNITKINSLGYPDPDPNPWVPTPTETNIEVTVEILPWTLIDSDHQLGLQ